MSATSCSAYFVVRKYQRHGVGECAARTLFDRFPGRWRLGTVMTNTVAQLFWRCVLTRYTDGRCRETVEDSPRWRGPVWTFESRVEGGA